MNSAQGKIVRRAIKEGVLVRAKQCELCGRGPEPRRVLDAHHHNGYDDLLDVQWLCRSCHSRIHGLRFALAGYLRKTPAERTKQTRHAGYARVVSLSPARLAEIGVIAGSTPKKKWMCGDCDLVSNGRGIQRHQRSKNHRGARELSDV